MDDSHHSLSPSPTHKRSAAPQDEDEENYQQISPNLQNLKKPTAKNYMSSTISAASKAIAPRKKILAERNEASEPSSFDTNVKKIATFESSYEPFSRTELNSPSVSQFHGSDDENDADLSSSKPYDPLTNYLSPRPRFLRYKPNRRREIFRGRENETGEEEDGITSGSGSFDSLERISDEAALDANCGASTSGGDSPAQEDEEVEGGNEEMEESDDAEFEEEDEEEDEKSCNLKGVFKTLLLLVVFVLSTMFISSMNSATPSCDLRFHDGMQNCTFETDLVNCFRHPREGREIGLLEVNKKLENNFLMEEGNIALNEAEVEADKLKEAVDSGEVDNVEVAETDDHGELAEPEIGGEFSQMVGNSESQGAEEPIVKVEFSEDYQTLFSSEHHDSGSYASSFFESESRIPVNSDEEVHNEKVVNFEEVEMIMSEMIPMQMNTEFLSKVLIVVLSFSTIFTSLFLWFRLRPENTMKKDSSPREKPSSESLLVEHEKISGKDSSSLPTQPFIEERRSRSVLPTREDANIDQVYSFGKSIEKAPPQEEYSESRAPTVEFLGEFVVGEIKGSGKAKMTKESEESLSNNSVPSSKTFAGKSHSVSVQRQMARSEFSIVDSPSYGSYTEEKEIVKKVESRDGETNFATPKRRSSKKGEVLATTPVRRSSRIRSLRSP